MEKQHLLTSLCTALSLSLLPLAVQASESSSYGADAYTYLETIAAQYSSRTNEENARSESLNAMGEWISSELTGFGYEVEAQSYNHLDTYTGINYIATKPGTSEQTVYVGAHYDCVDTAGIDDNGSGVSVLLELAKRFYSQETDATIKFCFWDNEEYGGYVGSCNYVNTVMIPNGDLERTLCYINLDSIAAGDHLSAYGGYYDDDHVLQQDWVYKNAMLTANDLGIDLYSLPEQVTEFETPTRIMGSDHYYFYTNGVPYLYLEASLWCDADGTGGNADTLLTCHYQTANSAFESSGGQVMHTSFDDLETLNELLPGRVQTRLTETSQLITELLLHLNESTEAEMAHASLPEEPAETSTEAPTTEEAVTQTETESETEVPAASALTDTTITTLIFIVAGILILLFVGVILYHSIVNHRRKKRRHKKRKTNR